MALCFLAITARLVMRTVTRQWKYWVTEALLVLAWMCLTALLVGSTYQYLHSKTEEIEFYSASIAKVSLVIGNSPLGSSYLLLTTTL